MARMKWNVYFRQINQTRYEVEAKDRDEAASKALKQWKKDYTPPDLISIEEVR